MKQEYCYIFIEKEEIKNTFVCMLKNNIRL